MNTVGKRLQEARQKKGFSLAQVEKATKIRAKFLKAIEQDDYSSMPSKTYVQGFVKNYADFLGLSSHTILALFRRQFDKREKEKNKIIKEPLSGTKWQITPNKVIMALIIVLMIALFSYFYTQYRALHQPPPLKLAHPTKDQVVKDDLIAIFGDTDVDATVTINGEPVLVKEDGKFYKDIPLNIGNNTIVVESTSRVGEKTSISRKVTRLADDSGRFSD